MCHCIYNSADVGLRQSAFPPGDSSIQNLLKAINQSTKPVQAQYLLFLETMFEVVHATVKQNILSHKYHDQALQWYNYLQNGNREKLYGEITLKTKAKLQVSIAQYICYQFELSGVHSGISVFFQL